MFWFLLHLESRDKSPTHLRLNFVGCGAAGGEGFIARATVKCICIHRTAPHRIIILIAYHFHSWAPFRKQGLTRRRRVNTFKRIWHPVMEEKTLLYCWGPLAPCWAYAGVSHCLVSPNWIKFVCRTDAFGWRGKHRTRRCQGWNCFENRFCLHRTSTNSGEKYSIKEHLWLAVESNKHFPFGADSEGSYFLLFSQRPSYACVNRVSIQNKAEVVSSAHCTSDDP